MLGRSPDDVAVFLARTQGLDKAMIGDYLGEREEFSLKVGGGRVCERVPACALAAVARHAGIEFSRGRGLGGAVSRRLESG